MSHSCTTSPGLIPFEAPSFTKSRHCQQNVTKRHLLFTSTENVIYVLIILSLLNKMSCVKRVNICRLFWLICKSFTCLILSVNKTILSERTAKGKLPTWITHLKCKSLLLNIIFVHPNWFKIQCRLSHIKLHSAKILHSKNIGQKSRGPSIWLNMPKLSIKHTHLCKFQIKFQKFWTKL